MKSSGQLKHFIFAFAIAVVVYWFFYSGIEHLNTRHGPWQVTFDSSANHPALIVNQPILQITNLTISFPRETAPLTNVTTRFEQPRQVPFGLPFGQCVFEDTMSLPGTIVFIIFGHEIQLLPRTLTIDKAEIRWQSNTNIVLQ